MKKYFTEKKPKEYREYYKNIAIHNHDQLAVPEKECDFRTKKIKNKLSNTS